MWRIFIGIVAACHGRYLRCRPETTPDDRGGRPVGRRSPAAASGGGQLTRPQRAGTFGGSQPTCEVWAWMQRYVCPRSEERRAGNEGRSRGRPTQPKKKETWS